MMYMYQQSPPLYVRQLPVLLHCLTCWLSSWCSLKRREWCLLVESLKMRYCEVACSSHIPSQCSSEPFASRFRSVAATFGIVGCLEQSGLRTSMDSLNGMAYVTVVAWSYSHEWVDARLYSPSLLAYGRWWIDSHDFC